MTDDAHLIALQRHVAGATVRLVFDDTGKLQAVTA